MKYGIIPIIGLGLTLSLFLGIEYNCNGQEMFPTYYGNPFVFKMKSLGSSMEYYYSVSGLLLNVGIWSIVITSIRYGFIKLIEMTLYKKSLKIIYNTLIGLLLVFTLLNISIAYLGLGRGFNKNLNYWYWDLDQEAKEWEVKCQGELIFFHFK